jgi:hypothetical protein
MKRNLNITNLIVLALLLILGSAVAATAQTKLPARAALSKTEKMLKEISANYRPFQGANSFLVSYVGKEIKEIDLIVVEAGEGIAVLVDVAAGKDLELTPDVMRKLLEFNMRADYIKVGISDLGSIRVGSELDLLSVSPKGFGKVLDQAAAGADEVAGIIAPFKKGARTVK